MICHTAVGTRYVTLPWVNVLAASTQCAATASSLLVIAACYKPHMYSCVGGAGM